MPGSVKKQRRGSTKFITGEEVKAWRVSRGLTKKFVGTCLGLTPGAVSKYEERGATKSTALALSAIDRGLKPYKATRADMRAIERQQQKEI